MTNVLNTVKKDSPMLYGVVVLHFLAMGGSILLLNMDDRVLMGVNVWIKPLKFALSGGIYILTLGYLITFYPYPQRKKSIINNTVALSLLLELIIIFLQAGRGIQSHYNNSTPLDGLLFGSMGLLIGLNVIIMGIFILDTIRLKINMAPSIQWAVLIGWLVVLFGSWIGGQMISQMGHNVGVPDGGAGLPLVNWSTTGGDLRVAHFFGLHGIQVIPLFSLWIYNRWELSNKSQIIAVGIFGFIYALLIGLVFYNAKQGMPLITI